MSGSRVEDEIATADAHVEQWLQSCAVHSVPTDMGDPSERKKFATDIYNRLSAAIGAVVTYPSTERSSVVSNRAFPTADVLIPRLTGIITQEQAEHGHRLLKRVYDLRLEVHNAIQLEIQGVREEGLSKSCGMGTATAEPALTSRELEQPEQVREALGHPQPSGNPTRAEDIGLTQAITQLVQIQAQLVGRYEQQSSTARPIENDAAFQRAAKFMRTHTIDPSRYTSANDRSKLIHALEGIMYDFCNAVRDAENLRKILNQLGPFVLHFHSNESVDDMILRNARHGQYFSLVEQAADNRQCFVRMAQLHAKSGGVGGSGSRRSSDDSVVNEFGSSSVIGGLAAKEFTFDQKTRQIDKDFFAIFWSMISEGPVKTAYQQAAHVDRDLETISSLYLYLISRTATTPLQYLLGKKAKRDSVAKLPTGSITECTEVARRLTRLESEEDHFKWSEPILMVYTMISQRPGGAETAEAKRVFVEYLDQCILSGKQPDSTHIWMKASQCWTCQTGTHQADLMISQQFSAGDQRAIKLERKVEALQRKIDEQKSGNPIKAAPAKMEGSPGDQQSKAGQGGSNSQPKECQSCKKWFVPTKVRHILCEECWKKQKGKGRAESGPPRWQRSKSKAMMAAEVEPEQSQPQQHLPEKKVQFAEEDEIFHFAAEDDILRKLQLAHEQKQAQDAPGSRAMTIRTHERSGEPETCSKNVAVDVLLHNHIQPVPSETRGAKECLTSKACNKHHDIEMTSDMSTDPGETAKTQTGVKAGKSEQLEIKTVPSEQTGPFIPPVPTASTVQPVPSVPPVAHTPPALSVQPPLQTCQPFPYLPPQLQVCQPFPWLPSQPQAYLPYPWQPTQPQVCLPQFQLPYQLQACQFSHSMPPQLQAYLPHHCQLSQMQACLPLPWLQPQLKNQSAKEVKSPVPSVQPAVPTAPVPTAPTETPISVYVLPRFKQSETQAVIQGTCPPSSLIIPFQNDTQSVKEMVLQVRNGGYDTTYCQGDWSVRPTPRSLKGMVKSSNWLSEDFQKVKSVPKRKRSDFSASGCETSSSGSRTLKIITQSTRTRKSRGPRKKTKTKRNSPSLFSVTTLEHKSTSSPHATTEHQQGKNGPLARLGQRGGMMLEQVMQQMAEVNSVMERNLLKVGLETLWYPYWYPGLKTPPGAGFKYRALYGRNFNDIRALRRSVVFDGYPISRWEDSDWKVRHYLDRDSVDRAILSVRKDERDVSDLCSDDPQEMNTPYPDHGVRAGILREDEFDIFCEYTAVDIITANHGAAHYTFPPSQYELPESFGMRARGGCRCTTNSHECCDRIFEDYWNLEGYRYGRVRPSCERAELNRYQIRYQHCHFGSTQILGGLSWKKLWQLPGRATFVADQGLYRPGPWAPEEMPPWIDSSLFRPSPLPPCLTPEELKNWKPRPLEQQYMRDEAASRCLDFWVRTATSNEDLLRFGLKMFTRFSKSFRHNGFPAVPSHIVQYKHPYKSANKILEHIGAKEPPVNVGDNAVEQTEAPKTEKGDQSAASTILGSTDSSSIKLSLSTHNDFSFKTKVIRIGRDHQQHGYQRDGAKLRWQYDSQGKADSTWFSGKGKELSKAGCLAQALYVYAIHGQQLELPTRADGVVQSEQDGVWSLYDAMFEPPPAVCGKELGRLIDHSQVYDRFCKHRVQITRRSPVTKSFAERYGKFFTDTVQQIERCKCFGDSIKWLNDNRAQQDSYWGCLFNKHPVHPNPVHPNCTHTVPMWDCFLDAMNYPSTTKSDGANHRNDFDSSVKCNASQLSTVGDQNIVRYKHFVSCSTAPPAIVDTGADDNMCPRKYAVEISKKAQPGQVDGIDGVSKQLITEQGFFPLIITDHATRHKSCTLIPVQIYETPSDVPILGVGKMRQCGFQVSGLDKFEEQLTTPSGHMSYLYQTKTAGHFQLSQFWTPKPLPPRSNTQIKCDSCVYIQQGTQTRCILAGRSNDPTTTIVPPGIRVGEMLVCNSPSAQKQPHMSLTTNLTDYANDYAEYADQQRCDTGDAPFMQCFKAHLEHRVGQNVQHDHNVFNHCGPEKHKHTIQNTKNMFAKLTKQDQVQYLRNLNQLKCPDCAVTPTLKPGISAHSGRRKVDTRHAHTVAKLNVTADAVKTGVRLAFSEAFVNKTHRGDYHITPVSQQEGESATTTLSFSSLAQSRTQTTAECDRVHDPHLCYASTSINVSHRSHGASKRLQKQTLPLLGTTPLNINIAVDDPHVYRWLTPVPIQGKVISKEGYERRIDIDTLRVFERCWIDLKTLPTGQYRGYQYALIMVCYKSFCIDVELMKTKDETADCVAKLVARRGIHKLPYSTTFHHDSDGANLAIAVKLSGYGIRTEPTVPYRQSLQLAELAIRIIVKAAKRNCFHARFHHMWLGLALQHAAHHHNFIAGSESRGFKSPNEILFGTKQDITDLQPFGVMVHVAKTDPKKRNKRFNDRQPLEVLTTAVPGFHVGYQGHFFNKTKRILTLDGNIVHSMDVYFKDNDPRDPNEINPRVFVHSFDGTNFKVHEDLISSYNSLGYSNMSDEELVARVKLIPIKGSKGTEFVDPEASLDSILKRFYPGFPFDEARRDLLEFILSEEEAQEEELPEGWEEREEEEIPKVIPEKAGEDKPVEFKPTHQTRSGTVFGKTFAVSSKDHQTSSESSPSSTTKVGEDYSSQDPQVKHIKTHHTSKTAEESHATDINMSLRQQGIQLEPANSGTTCTTKAQYTRQEGHESDNHLADENGSVVNRAKDDEKIRYCRLMKASYNMAEQITWANDKDIPWKRALEVPSLREGIINAYQEEYDSLTKIHKVLQRLEPNDEEYPLAVKQACKARAILGIKRCGRKKVRIVLRGDLQDIAKVDPPDFNYYARVVSLTSVRMALGSYNAADECIAFIDISTAFLQSDRYDKSVKKYVVLKNPITGELIYFKQLGSIYGEISAPALWERTIASWIVEQEFIRGENDPCCFYHMRRRMRITLYVDDLKMIGGREHILWFHTLIRERFQTRELEWLEPGKTQDYLGMEITMDQQRNLFVSMQSYALKVIHYMETEMHEIGPPTACPYIETQGEMDTTPLNKQDKVKFQKALGCIGWLCSCIRCDLAYAYSRIAQDMSCPNMDAWKHLVHVIRYLKGSYTWAGFVPAKRTREALVWNCYCDSDQTSDRSERNQGKCRYGSIITISGFPVQYKTQTTSVAMAHPDLGTDGNVCTSSTEAEIYGAANATFHVMHVSYVAEELGHKFPIPFILQMDNAAAEVFCNNTASYSRLKHIDLRQKWVKKLRDKNIMIPKHIDTKLNVADMFTKGLTGSSFKNMRDQVLIQMKPFNATTALIIFYKQESQSTLISNEDSLE